MRVLCVHNFYQFAGGEGRVFQDESQLLEEHGHDVTRLTFHNDNVKDFGKLALAKNTIWNSEIYDKIFHLVHEKRIEVAHFHNTLPLVSPSAYHAARKAGARVVQTLHNFRHSCASSFLFRNGKVCEDCLGKFFSWPGVLHGCYRESRAATAMVAATTTTHKLLGTWDNKIDRYIVMTNFGRQKSIESGIPEEKIVLKPHFILRDTVQGRGEGGYALFVGRLSTEKGLDIILDIWANDELDIPLKIVGNGPLKSRVEELANANSNISYEGFKKPLEVRELMGQAMMTLVPSIGYETFGLVVMESFASGTPVISSDLGSVGELVENGVTGLTFPPGDKLRLAQAVRQLAKTTSTEMRRAVRGNFESKYSAEKNYQLLIGLYESIRGNNAA